MTAPIIRPSAKDEATSIADRWDAEGAFVLILKGGGGVQSAFVGTPKGTVDLPSLLRQMAADYERRSGFVGSADLTTWQKTGGH